MNEHLPPVASLDATRYAVYFAPDPDSAWWQAGSHWLGRCAARGEVLPLPALTGVSNAEQERITRVPRRYGWHATLKAPFALAPGVDLHQLRTRLRELGRGLQPFDLPRLKVAVLGNFLALVPVESCPGIDGVARACVVGLHDLAAPPALEELERRRAAGLAPDENALLDRWGYPFVMQRFRFHMSLTGPLEGVAPGVVRLLEEAAIAWFDALPASRFDSLTLFAEPAAGADFVVVEQIKLGSLD